VTFTADAACTDLPAVARSRTYIADVRAETAIVRLGGAQFGAFGGISYSQRAGIIYQRRHSDAVEWWFQDPEIWELLDSDRYVVIYGGPTRIPLASDTTALQAADFTTWARIKYCSERDSDTSPRCAVPENVCESNRHTLTIARR
jgi:hypothetical protein